MDSATSVVVDTDVISFIFKDHQLAPAYEAILAGRSLTVSLVTLAEITPLLPDIDTGKQWALVKSGCEKKGRPISFPDAWIAAAALQLHIPLVTRNASDYESIDGLTILTATTVA